MGDVSRMGLGKKSYQIGKGSAPDQPFGEYLSGRHALFNNQYGIAADNYLKALALDPENISLNQFTLSILITDGRFDDAIKIAVSEFEKKHNYMTALAAANAFRDVGKISNALEFYGKCLDYDPENIALKIDMAEIFVKDN